MKNQAHIEQIGVSEFKSKCLSLLDKTGRLGREYIITKKGQALAKVSPITTNNGSSRDCFKGFGKECGDIVSFDTSEDWEVNS